MTGTKGTLLAARLAGCFFLLVGLVGMALAWPGRADATGSLAGGDLWPVAAIAVGLAAAAFLVPWSSLPRPAGLVLPVAALILLVVVEELTDYSSSRGSAAVYPIYLILVLAWVGLTQPRTTAALFALSGGAALAYVLLRSRHPVLPLSSLAVVLPAGVALGETCSWLVGRVQVLSARDERRARQLDRLARLTGQLPALRSAQEAADLVARAAAELFDGVQVTVQLADPDGGWVTAHQPAPRPAVEPGASLALTAELPGRHDARTAAEPAGSPHHDPQPEPEPGHDATPEPRVRTGPAEPTATGGAAVDAGQVVGDEQPGAEHAGKAERAASAEYGGPERRAAREQPGGHETAPRDDAVAASDTALALPLVGSSTAVGTLRLATGPRRCDEYTVTLARLFASQVGTALEQFLVIRRLDRAAHRDDLTGTGNRRHAEALLRGLRDGDALLLVDLDHFKTVNDTWGHRAGDEVLQALGAYLQSCVRSSDDVARYGGDEFVVLARGAGNEIAATADRLLVGWRAADHKTTISIGVSVHQAGVRPDATLDAADAALYAAKSQGRNRVAIGDAVAR